MRYGRGETRVDAPQVAGPPHIALFAQIKLDQVARIQIDTLVNSLFRCRVIGEVSVIFAPDHGLAVTGIRPQNNAKHLILHKTPADDCPISVNETLPVRQINFRVASLIFVAQQSSFVAKEHQA
ncbi:hypothetical protein [Mameliella sediminis]|uniref:hypothetical protein n=1 Tax=Mameliella sediminis TaxID=2836866 RepID=UPI001C48AEB1|nr:hypothetical protein [Mameliella sediminis]MBY6114344.1 hypothetical protein [Antarctobacter heliothermus]MBY6163353.1 hypothetical protein [Mameliella alba]MBV7393175.1 hypothetical protein [Mameliella sediminis]MBY6171616.1 hypothetical protein [Mameliella alba]MBY6176841.1 hypothetical protein [Mameliella alba]